MKKASKKKSAKKMNMPKFRDTLKKHGKQHKAWKKTIKDAINNGEHGAADTALSLLNKSKDALHKILEHVEGHATKKRPKV